MPPKKKFKGVRKGGGQGEMGRKLTGREEGVKDMSGVGKGDGPKNVERYVYVWLSFVGVDYG